MTRRRCDRRAAAIAERWTKASTFIPQLRDHCDEQRSNITTLSRHELGPSNGDYSDPTALTVMALAKIDQLEGSIDDHLATTELALKLFDETCRDILGRRQSVDPPYCAGQADTGGRCEHYVSHRIGDGGSIHFDSDGLCDRHRLAERDNTRRADAANCRRLRRHRT